MVQLSYFPQACHAVRIVTFTRYNTMMRLVEVGSLDTASSEHLIYCADLLGNDGMIALLLPLVAIQAYKKLQTNQAHCQVRIYEY